MEENIRYIKLFDIYGNLLTEKQKNNFKLYYMDDLSLREIAELYNISFQSVRDSIEVSKKLLDNYENNIKMLEKNSYIDELKKLLINVDNEDVKNILMKL